MSEITYTDGPLYEATKQFPTVLWNDSSDLDELTQSISFGGVGATCNPQIAYTTLSNRPDIWTDRIRQIANENPTWSESEIGWQAVKNMSVEAAKLLEPAFKASNGRNGRLSVQTDPRLHRNAKALADQAEEFHNLADNIVVKIPATKTGIEAIEDATSRGVSINVTVSFSVPQAVEAAAAIERGLEARKAAGASSRSAATPPASSSLPSVTPTSGPSSRVATSWSLPRSSGRSWSTTPITSSRSA